VPDGWVRVPSTDGAVVLGGPLVAGARPTIALAREPFDPPTPDGLARGLAALRSIQIEEYPGFALLAERTVEVDGRWAHVEHFRWQHEGTALTQLFALIVIEPGMALQIDGVCLTDLEAEHLVDLDAIVASIGFPAVDHVAA